MVAGPDPNRWTEVDPQAPDGGVGDPKTSRLGAPSWLSALLAVVLLAIVAGVLIF
jgi:hypothetical protein